MHATPLSPRLRFSEASWRSRLKSWLELLCAAGFVVSIGLVPMMTWLRPGGEQVLAEQRKPARHPGVPHTAKAVLDWPVRFELWWNDAWAVRGALLQQRQALFVLGLRVSPTQKLMLGKEGWLFPGNEDAVRQHRGLVPLDRAELTEWQRVLEARAAVCAEQGAAYVFVLAPSKLSVYPERLPAGLERLGPTRADQLVAFLHAHSGVPILDLRQPLARERERDTADDFAYFPLGTHWTDRGAFAAYTTLLEQLRSAFPSLVPAGRERFEWIDAPSDPGDTWAGRLYLKGRLVQRVRTAVWRGKPTLRTVSWGEPIDTGFETDRNGAPRLLMFHDSNGPYVRPFLAPHFARSLFKWTDRFDAGLVAQEKPDIVVHLATEDRALATGTRPEMP